MPIVVVHEGRSQVGRKGRGGDRYQDSQILPAAGCPRLRRTAGRILRGYHGQQHERDCDSGRGIYRRIYRDQR